MDSAKPAHGLLVPALRPRLLTGTPTTAEMHPRKRQDKKELRQQIKQLEKSLEKANVMIYSLNAIIDYAEQELKVPLRKKHGTRQSR